MLPRPTLPLPPLALKCARHFQSYVLDLSGVRAHYSAGVAPDAALTPHPPPTKQQVLSTALDAAELQALVATSTGEADRAHLKLLQSHAPPPPVASSEVCDGVADRFGDFGGDRCKRRNRLRTLLTERPRLQAFRPISKSQTELGACEAGAASSSSSGGRRPANVFVPNWGLHGPAVFDLAVGSGLRCGASASSAADGSHACAACEKRKRMHLDTADLCQQQGLQFVPLIAESSCAGWGPATVKAWRAKGALLAVKSGQTAGTATEQLLECLSVTLQRENARAVLRRLPDCARAADTLLQNL